jgi:hypothetical protein
MKGYDLAIFISMETGEITALSSKKIPIFKTDIVV